MATVTLQQRITVNRDGKETDVSEIAIRKPAAREFVRHGSPFIWKSMDIGDARARPVFNDKIVAKFLTACSDLDEAAIGTLTAPDYISARLALLLEIITGNTANENADERVVKLSAPVVTHAGSVAELKLSTPLAKTVIAFGLPFDWRQDENDNPYVVYDDRKCMKYLVELTGHDELSLEDISAPDWFAMRQKLFTVLSRVVGTSRDPQ